jgi:hypothetical protein
VQKAPVIHPFLFAVFPVLFLLAQNIQLFDMRVILRPMAASISLTLLCWGALSLVLKDRRKAGLIVSLFLLLFFSYEALFDYVRPLIVGALGGYLLGMRAYVLLGCAVILGVGGYFITRTRGDFHGSTNAANVVAAFLVGVSLVNIVAYEIETRSTRQQDAGREMMDPKRLAPEQAAMLPNIFYIVLDEYAGPDILEEIYQYDNTEFINYLARTGFYVADKSMSNYSQTCLSLASSLNLTYLDDLVAQVGVESRDYRAAASMIRDSTVVRFLKQYGYEIVAFSSGYSVTGISDADLYMAPRGDLLLSEFDRALMDMTPLTFVLNALGLQSDPADSKRERILYTFDHLVEVSEGEGPLFVFAHIMAPHSPFVFGQHGQEIDASSECTWGRARGFICNQGSIEEEYLAHYTDQLTFINSRVEGTVDGILSRSARRPIILLQADTGPAAMLDREDPDNTYLKERFSILNAYYLPNDGDVHLHDGITPVNSFRIVFNHYFGADYELLEDESYFSTATHPYKFINVTGEIER